MKQSKIRLIQEFLVTQLNFIVFYPLCMTAATLFNDIAPAERARLWVWMLGGVVVFAMYLIRIHTKSFTLLVLLHGSCFGIMLLLGQLLSPNGSSSNRSLFLIVSLGFVIYSIYLRLQTEDFEDRCMNMPFAVGFIAVTLFMQHYQNNKQWDFYYKIVLILIVTLYFLNYYLREYLNFLIVNSSSTGILPEKEIFHSGLRLTILYVLLGGVILLGTSQLTWLMDFLAALKKLIVSIIRFISSLFPKAAPSLSDPILNETGGGAAAMPLEGGEPSMIWYIIFGIAVVALIIVILTALFMAIRRFISFVTQMMKRDVVQLGEISTTGAVDVREKCEIQKSTTRRKKGLELFGFLDNREKIRHIYKKKAAAYKPSALMNNSPRQQSYTPERLAFYTAREMEAHMNSGAFAEIYEKARYSKEACTPQDVKLMKEYCK